MASKAKNKPKRLTDGPVLLSVRKKDGAERVAISYRTVRGRSAKAVFAANDDVETVLERWNEQGKLDPPDREVLDDHSLEGWGAAKAASKNKEKARSKPLRVTKTYEPPAISPKEARLAEEAKALAGHKDEFRSYWAIIALVTLLSLSLLGLTPGRG